MIRALNKENKKFNLLKTRFNFQPKEKIWEQWMQVSSSPFRFDDQDEKSTSNADKFEL